MKNIKRLIPKIKSTRIYYDTPRNCNHQEQENNITIKKLIEKTMGDLSIKPFYFKVCTENLKLRVEFKLDDKKTFVRVGVLEIDKRNISENQEKTIWEIDQKKNKILKRFRAEDSTSDKIKEYIDSKTNNQ